MEWSIKNRGWYSILHRHDTICYIEIVQKVSLINNFETSIEVEIKRFCLTWKVVFVSFVRETEEWGFKGATTFTNALTSLLTRHYLFIDRKNKKIW